MAPEPATPVTIHYATESDIPSLAQNESDAFTSTDSPEERSNLGEVMFGPPTPDRQERRVKDLVQKMHTLPEARFFKAVASEDGKDRIVGFALWHFYTDPIPVEDTWQDQAWEGAANPAACNEFIGAMAQTRTKHMGGKRFIRLDILTVDPAYQRRGIGSQLMRAGLEEGEKLGLNEAYVESSPAGYGLYRKWGFEDVDIILLDLQKYGGNSVDESICMIWRNGP